MKKLILGILVAMLVMVLLAPTALAKPDMSKPLPATDVQLVKKVTVEGKAGWRPRQANHTGSHRYSGSERVRK
jgi:hypothetical protein